MSFTDRLSQVIEHQCNGHKKKFSELSGIPYSTLVEYLSGRKKDPKLSMLSKIKNVNAFWLLYGEGEMVQSKSIASDVNIVADGIVKYRSTNNNKGIPLFNIEASAGLVSLFQSQNSINPIGFIEIPNLPKCDGAVYVTGDSMYPLLKSGDIVAYKRLYDFKTEIFWGEMYLVSVEVADEEFISVKYIQKSELGIEWIKLVSQNNHHDSKDVNLNKVRAIALVKATVRINSM